MADPAAYHVLILAPLAPVAPATHGGSPRPALIELDAADPAASLADVAPVIRVDVDGLTDFAPRTLDDFTPRTLSQTLDCFAAAGAQKTYPFSPSGPYGEDAPTPSGSVVDDIMDMVDTGGPAPSGTAAPPIGGAEGRLMRKTLSDPAFRALEAAWRGVMLLRGNPETMRLSAVAVDQSTLLDTLRALPDMLADSPPDLVALGVDLDGSPLAFEIMRALAECADTLLSPVLFGLSPAFFGVESWKEAKGLQYLPHLLEQARYAPFHSLARREGAAWLLPVAGDAPSRPAYGKGAGQADGPFPFTDPGPPPVSPAFCAAAAVIGSLGHTGWPSGSMQSPPLAYAMSDHRSAELEQTPILGISPASRPAAARTLDGSPLVTRLRFARLVAFLLRLRAAHPEAQDGPAVEAVVRQGFADMAALFGGSGPDHSPDELQIEAAAAPDGGVALSVSLRLDGETLPVTLHW